MAENMNAAVLTQANKIEILSVEKPQPAEKEVLIKIVCAGICGSELHAYKGLHKRRVPPVILGHEFAGVVEAVGENVKNIAPGDRVTAVPMYGCGSCPECFRGETSLCATKSILGSQKWPGAYADYCVVPEDLVYKLPDNVSFEAGALIEPLAVGLHAVRTAQICAGDKVAVLGAGAIGLCTAVMAAQAGAVPLICTDIQPFNLEKAGEMGATHVLDSRDERLIEKVLEISDGGCDCVFVTAPVNALVDQALSMVRRQGQVICVAMFDGQASVNVELNRARETIITGTSMYYEKDFERIINMLSYGRLDVEAMISHKLPMSQADDAFRMYMDRVPGIVKILLYS